MIPPNIIYIHSHDTGRYVQPYGHAVATPGLQRLADEGTLFRQAFAAAPTCSPSRAALLTGQAAHRSGMIGLVHRGFRLNDVRQHLAHVLGEAGYETVVAGMHHVVSDEELPHDVHIKSATNLAKDVAPAVEAYLGEVSAEIPFFLSIGFFETHRPFDFDGISSAEIAKTNPPSTLPDTPEIRCDMAAYNASARDLDAGISCVLEALDANDLAKNTLTICTTDHGIAFPHMKCNLTQHGLGVMLMLRGPGIAPGTVSDALVSHIDLFPTVCDMLGIAAPEWLQGQSLVPLLTGDAQAVNDAVFGEVTYHAAYQPMRSVRTLQYNYIRQFGERRQPVLSNIDDSPGKTLLVAQGLGQRALASEELYDLTFDPQERHNLASNPAYADTLAAMRQRLDQWMHDCEDPLLSGEVPPHDGALINYPDALSPKEPTYAYSLH